MPWHKPRVRQADGDCVILLHGLWRSYWAMEPMARHLHQIGYQTINVPYPSFRLSPDENMRMVLKLCQSATQKNQTIHFVTHSLGGLITRKLLVRLPESQLGRVVMLAPPNRGSEIADWLDNYPALKCLLGPAGKELGQSTVNAPPIPEPVDAAVIMGNRSLIPLFRKLLEPSNDGIVSVNSGKIEGLKEFHVIPSDHTLIASEPEVMDLTARFLNDGPDTE